MKGNPIISLLFSGAIISGALYLVYQSAAFLLVILVSSILIFFSVLVTGTGSSKRTRTRPVRRPSQVAQRSVPVRKARVNQRSVGRVA